jgi:hypothetical protein
VTKVGLRAEKKVALMVDQRVWWVLMLAVATVDMRVA